MGGWSTGRDMEGYGQDQGGYGKEDNAGMQKEIFVFVYVPYTVFFFFFFILQHISSPSTISYNDSEHLSTHVSLFGIRASSSSGR